MVCRFSFRYTIYLNTHDCENFVFRCDFSVLSVVEISLLLIDLKMKVTRIASGGNRASMIEVK